MSQSEESMNALHVRSVYCSTLLLLVILVCSAAALAQVSDADTERGIALYQKHDYKQAKELFQSITKANAENLLAWHYLALSLEASITKRALAKAHEKAAKLEKSYWFWVEGLSSEGSADGIGSKGSSDSCGGEECAGIPLAKLKTLASGFRRVD